MKKKLILITLLLLSNIVLAQYTTIVKAAEEKNKPEEYIEYYDSGKVSLKTFIDKEGKLNGKTTVYYENGNIKAEGEYDNGEKNGMWRYYYENRKLKITESYFNGIAKIVTYTKAEKKNQKVNLMYLKA